MHSFSQHDLLYAEESNISRQTLESHLKKFRVSEDFSIAKNTIIKPNQTNTVKIHLDKKLFPPMNTISLGMFKHLEISMRSCFAQSGIHIVGKLFDYIQAYHMQELNETGATDLDVFVLNRGLSDVEVQKGVGFFRLYFRPSGQMITGQELFDIVASGGLKIAGEYGETWNLVGAKGIDLANLDDSYEAMDLDINNIQSGLTLKLKLTNKVYIPDNKNGVLIESKKNLVDVLQPFDNNNPKHKDHDFNIGETYYVDFGDYFGAIIYQGYDGGGHHIISPLIDPGFAGPIRTEIVKGKDFNDFIELHIYHKDG